MIKILLDTLRAWFNFAHVDNKKAIEEEPNKINWLRVTPFIALHLVCLMAFFVGYSLTAILAAVFLYALRVFAITAFYHRYFSHRTFTCNRFWQFVFAYIGATATQRGPLWWASHHRAHHAVSDKEGDEHSPIQRGFWWSHTLWFLSNKNYPTNFERVKDWQKFPELVFINKYETLPPLTLALALFFFGKFLAVYFPQLQTNGWQLLIWGYFISTIAVSHVTFFINSLTHTWGRRRFDTGDTSRNNVILALLTFGEGWHNNHHYYSTSTRQGFYWYEIDITYYLLLLMSKIGIVDNIRKVPLSILEEGRRSRVQQAQPKKKQSRIDLSHSKIKAQQIMADITPKKVELAKGTYTK